MNIHPTGFAFCKVKNQHSICTPNLPPTYTSTYTMICSLPYAVRRFRIAQPCDVVVTRLPAKKRCWWCWCWRNPHPGCDMNNIRHAHQFHITKRYTTMITRVLLHTKRCISINIHVIRSVHKYRPSNVLLYHRTPSSLLYSPHIKFNPQLWILILHFHFSLYASLWWCGAAAWIC